MKNSKTKFLIILAIGVALLWGGSYLFLPGSSAQQELKTEELEHQLPSVVATAPGYTPPGPIEKEPIFTEDAKRAQRQTNVIHTPTASDKALLTEDFEGGAVPPTGWSVIVNNPYTWEIDTYNPYEGNYYGTCLYDETYSGTQDEWLISPVIDLTTKGEAWHVSFFWNMSYYWGVSPYDNYELEVWISTDGGDNFTTKLWCEEDVGVFETWVWYMADVDLADYLTYNDVKLGFRYYGYDGAQASIDFISVDVAGMGRCCYGDPYTPDCADVTEEECDVLGGTWDAGLNCTDHPCPVLTPGDNCDDPMVVNLPADLPYTDAGQTNCGRGNDYDATCLGSYDGGEDMIYQVNVTSAVAVDITMDPKGTTWTGMALDDDCPLDPSTCLYKSTGSSGSRILSNVQLDPGTYYIMIDTYPTPDCIPDFDLTITAYTGPPANDDCGNAEAVGDVTDLAFSTTNASFDGLGDCMTSPNIWYCYTATCNGTAVVSLCGSGYDTKLAVYDGCVCDPLGAEIECNDDFCGVQSEISFTAVQGNEYLIEVGGYSSNTGNGILNISCAGPPDNDECTGAPVISTFPTTVDGTTQGATIDCPGVLDWNAVWYQFDLPYAYNDVFVDFCPTADDIYTVGVVLYGECPPDCPNYILRTGYQWVNCPNGSYNPQMWWDKLPGPASYWFPVHVIPAKGMDFSFEVSVTEAEPPPDGVNCDLPIEIDLPADMPYMDRDQTTCGMLNDYSNTCLGYYDGGEDIIYELTVTDQVHVNITFDPKGTTWNGIALDDACPLDPSTCLYTYTQSGGSPHSFDYDLSAGTYYIMIDTWPSPDCIPNFDLTIDVYGPQISVSPESFELILNQGELLCGSMFITNEGQEALNYEISHDPAVNWVEFLPTSGTVPPGGTDPVSLCFCSFDFAPGDYYDVLKIASNSIGKALDDTVEVPIHMVVQFAPDIDVVSLLSMGVIPGCEMAKGLRVDNFGEGELRFEVSIEESAPLLIGAPQGTYQERLLNEVQKRHAKGLSRSAAFSPVTGSEDVRQIDKSSITPLAAPEPGESKIVSPPGAGIMDLGRGDSLFYQRPLLPDESWSFSNSTYPDYKIYENFWDLAGSICDIHCWYLPAVYPWDNCDPAGMEFEIKFYSDDPTDHLNMPPSDVVCTHSNVVPSYVYFDDYSGFDTYYFSLDLDPCCELTDGWVSIQCTYSPNGCLFMWSNSPQGDGFAYQEGAGPLADLAIYLTGEPSAPPCPFTVSPEEGTVEPESFFDVFLTFDGNEFEECEDGVPPDTQTCYLVITSNDPDEPVVSVEVDMWSGRGNVFNEGCVLDLGDVLFLINFVLKEGPAPDPLCIGDCNPPHDGSVDIEDVMYLIQYLYQGGMPPLAAPEIGPPPTPTPLERK